MTTDPIAAAIRRGVATIIEAFDQERQLGGTAPDEEQLTALLWNVTYPQLVRVKFNRAQEARYGADWLWWFVGADGRCFGLLVQAKVMRGGPGRRRISFAHRNKTHGFQVDCLLESADALGVPATYVIYFGPPHTRPDLVAPASTDRLNAPWEPMAIAMYDALNYHRELCGFDPAVKSRFMSAGQIDPHDPKSQLDFTRNWVVQRAFMASRPLLALADGSHTSVWEKLPDIYPDFTSVQALLDTEQHGPARVASAILDYLASIAIGQFSRTTTAPAPGIDGAVFTELPDHQGHFDRPYIPYILRGYRRQPPAYVRDILEGNEINVPLPATVQGVVVIIE